MVELVDTQDLKSCSRKRSAGSIPALSTKAPFNRGFCYYEGQCESSSVGRARPCQGRGREFESRLSLIKNALPETEGRFLFHKVQSVR